MSVISAMLTKTQVLEGPREERMEAIVLPHIETLRRIRLFEGLSDEQLEVIALLCRQVHRCRGKVLFSEGDKATQVFAVLEGKVCLEVELFMGYHLRPVAVMIQTMEKGDTFGWSALVDSCRMAMTARCTQDVDMIVVNGDDLKALLKVHPDIGLVVMENVAKIVCDRLVHARQRLIAEHGLTEMYQAHRAY